MIGKKNNLIHTPSNPCTKDVCFEVYRGEVCVAWYKGPASLLNVAEPGGSDLVAKARAESEDTLADLLSALRKIGFAAGYRKGRLPVRCSQDNEL